jgi:uncharacterized protein (UPF0548 family)
LFSLTRWSDDALREHIARQAGLAFTYPAVGASAGPNPPDGYTVDHNRVLLGRGAEAFARARAAVARWEMFRLGWVELLWPIAPLAVGTTVGVRVRALGCWSLNCCRIVYLVDESGDVERFGFAYGTLPDHAESGEERFTVEWRRGDDSVWYDILAFSRPRHLLAKVGYPFSRGLQKRFAADSLRAMVRATSSG